MACALPVIGTQVGGNPELIEHAVTGLLVAPSDPIALAEAIGTYVDDPALAAAHGLAARQRVERELSIDGMIERYASLYEELVALKSRAR